MNTPLEGSPHRSFGQGSARCPVCMAQTHTEIRQIFDDRYGCPDLFSLVRCDGCGHWMTSPTLLENELGALYSAYYPRKLENTAEILAAAQRTKGVGERWRRWWHGTNNQGQYAALPKQLVLDVGCGSGQSVLEAQMLGATAVGVEADPNVRRIAEALNLRIHIGSMADVPFPGVQFDLIVANQVIEHVPEPGKMLDILRGRLNPDGKVILVFPNRNSLWRRLTGEHWINWHIPFHLHHFNAQSFRILAQRHGFKVAKCKTITPSIWTILQMRVLQEKPVRGVPGTAWRVSASPPSADPSIPTPSPARKIILGFLRCAALDITALINRLIDLMGQGDSLWVELKIKKS